MAYSTTDDLQQACGGADRLRQLFDWNNDRVADADVITKAIALADAQIDSYIGKQYNVPLVAPIPGPVARVSAQLAKYNTACDRGMLDQQIKTEHDAAIAWLEGVRDGLNSLGVEPAAMPAPSMRAQDGATPRPTSKDVSRRKMFGFS